LTNPHSANYNPFSNYVVMGSLVVVFLLVVCCGFSFLVDLSPPPSSKTKPAPARELKTNAPPKAPFGGRSDEMNRSLN
jgi:hypothetical protein